MIIVQPTLTEVTKPLEIFENGISIFNLNFTDISLH